MSFETIIAVLYWPAMFVICGAIVVLTGFLVFLVADVRADRLTRRHCPDPFDWQDIPDLADPLERQFALPAVEPRRRVR